MMKKILGATLSAAMTVGLMTAGVTGTTVFAEDNTADTKEADVIFCERKEWIGIEERSSA